MRDEAAGLGHGRTDLLVVGGGVHGLFAAYDAALRGWSVTLVESHDFGSGLSFNHQRTVHGGLRALESGHIGKVRQQVAERRTWAVLAPHLVRPLPFLVGTYRGSKRSRWLLRAGLTAYNVLGRSRNRGLAPGWWLPSSRVISVREATTLFPGLRPDGLTGGALWYDYQARHPDRLNWLVARAAREAGARLINGARVTGFVREGDRVTGAVVRLAPRTTDIEVSARATLLCAGAGLPSLLEMAGVPGAPPLVGAANILLNRAGPAMALAAPGRSGRMLTAVPWGGFTLVGTFQSERPLRSDETEPPLSRLDDWLADANVAFPALGATRDDVRLVHYGRTPATLRAGHTELLPEASRLDHGPHGARGLFSLVGVKFTTARHAAAEALDAISAAVDLPRRACLTDSRMLPAGSVEGAARALDVAVARTGAVLSADMHARLIDWYATEAADVLAHAASRDQLDVVGLECPVLRGELSYAVAHAQARRLADVVLRRTALGGFGHPGAEALVTAAATVGAEFGWSPAEQRAEIADVETRYFTSKALKT